MLALDFMYLAYIRIPVFVYKLPENCTIFVSLPRLNKFNKGKKYQNELEKPIYSIIMRRSCFFL